MTKACGAAVARHVRFGIGRDGEALALKLGDEADVRRLHVARGPGEKDGAAVRRDDRRGLLRRLRRPGAAQDLGHALLQSAREIIQFSVEPVVAFAAIEERRDGADVILIVARVEQEPFLSLQFRRAGAAVDIAFAHDKHPRRGIGDAGGFAQAQESLELLAAIGALHPVWRHDDDKKLGMAEPVVDDVGELVALADAAPVAPDIRLPRAEVAQLQAQLLIEEADEAEFVLVGRQDEVVVVRVGHEDDDVIAHRNSPLRLKRPRILAPIIRLTPWVCFELKINGQP